MTTTPEQQQTFDDARFVLSAFDALPNLYHPLRLIVAPAGGTVHVDDTLTADIPADILTRDRFDELVEALRSAAEDALARDDSTAGPLGYARSRCAHDITADAARYSGTSAGARRHGYRGTRISGWAGAFPHPAAPAVDAAAFTAAFDGTVPDTPHGRADTAVALRDAIKNHAVGTTIDDWQTLLDSVSGAFASAGHADLSTIILGALVLNRPDGYRPLVADMPDYLDALADTMTRTGVMR